MRLRPVATGFLLALVLLVSPASGQDGIGAKKQIIDARIDVLEKKIEAAREREGVLSSQIAVVTSKIRALQNDVDSASARLGQLETVLALHQRKLDRLNELYRVQTRKLVFLQRQHKAATARLNKRLVEIYTSDPTSALTVVLEAGELLRPARPARVPERHRPPGPPDRDARSRKRSCRCRRPGTRLAGRASRSRRRRGSWRTGPPSSAPCATGSPGASASSRPRAATSARRSRPSTRTRQTRSSTCASLQAQSAALAARIRSAAELVDRARSDRRRLGCRLRLAGARRPHERLRLALGTDARGHRHRRRRAGRRSSRRRQGR